MKDKIGDFQRLQHILTAINEIENYVLNHTKETFIHNSMMRFASIKQFEIIGEASNQITDETKNDFPDIKWRDIVGLRNILVHEYFGIDEELVWQIIQDDIPKLKKDIQIILTQLGSSK
jgi:uncharacterized protein with HEPN domain